MMFGAGASVRPWLGDPRIEIHGPGYSKVLFGADKADAWRDYLDLLVTSVSSNGGRSCINASSIRTPAHGREIAAALAERLAAIVPRLRDDASAILAAFPDPATARGIDAAIERGIAQGGAEDVSARFRGSRLVEFEGGTYLLPTVVYCEDPENPLANQEYLFPFVSVLDVPRAELTDSLGPSLVVTALDGRRAAGARPAGPCRDRPLEPRTRAHERIAVGPAARRQHFHAFVPATGIPEIGSQKSGDWKSK